MQFYDYDYQLTDIDQIFYVNASLIFLLPGVIFVIIVMLVNDNNNKCNYNSCTKPLDLLSSKCINSDIRLL